MGNKLVGKWEAATISKNSGYQFFYNYYLNVELMTELEQEQALCYGTVNMSHVGLAKDMIKTDTAVKHLKWGERLKQMKRQCWQLHGRINGLSTCLVTFLDI